MKQTWEYRVVQSDFQNCIEPSSFEEDERDDAQVPCCPMMDFQLNRLGRLGWELVRFAARLDGIKGWRYIFKRAIREAVIKPVETRYKGYRFRSRLEARWAVFFDALGIEWEYEHQSYDLGSLGYYLPDFWLPKHGLCLEVKGQEPTTDEVKRCDRLSADGMAICMFHGSPGKNVGQLWCWCVGDSSGGHGMWDARLYTQVHTPLLIATCDWGKNYYTDSSMNVELTCVRGIRGLWDGAQFRLDRLNDPFLENAAVEARSARFGVHE